MLQYLVDQAKKGTAGKPSACGYYVKDLDLYSELVHLPAVRCVSVP